MVYPKLLIFLINRRNKKKFTLESSCSYNETILMLSNQLVHIWHGVIQNVGAVLNMYCMGGLGGGT